VRVKTHPEDDVGMERRGVFLDLNGTLVEPLKPERLDEITLIPGVVEAVARLSAAGFVCPVVTVQSCIAKGLFSLPEFEIWFASFAGSLQTLGAHCRAFVPSSLCQPLSLQETEYRTLRSCGS
jgi:histidinol phosphatase-like enzyme